MPDEPVRGSVPPADFYSLSGSEQGRAWLRETVPATPLARLVGYRPTQFGSGAATFVMPASPWLQFAEGTVDLKMLIEETLGAAATSVAPPATLAVTASLATSHLRPSTVDGRSFIARARVLNSGSAFTTAEVLVEDAMGRATAHAIGAFLMRAIEPPPPPHRGFPDFEEPAYATPDPHARPSPPPLPTLSMPMREAARRTVLGEIVPPINRLLGARLTDFAGDGSGTVTMPASPWLCSRWTEIQRGPIATLMHMGLGVAAVAEASADEYIGIISQNLTFLAPVAADGRDIVARFRLVHRSDLLVSTIEVLDASGNRVATGTQTAVVRERRRRGRRTPPRERILATVMFTDIVASTERAEALGDDEWRQLLAEHHELVRRELATFGGREVKSTGDGFLAAFESPARAVHCARAIRDAVQTLGLEIRAGIHTGECEQIGQDLAGIAVHAASRIESAAAAGEILVSSTVHDLVAGSGLTFADRGLRELKGISGQRQLFAVAG